VNEKIMTMKTLTTKRTVLSLLLGGFFMFETNVAEAVVGAPLTPVSVAGVARRTTRRAVVATSAATSSAAAAQAATPAPSTTTVVVVPAPAPAPAPTPTTLPAPPPVPTTLPAPAAAPAVGTIVTSLPPGSQSVGDDFICNNVYYRPTIQGSKLVYVVVGYK
jgi:hypothetical protein